MIPGSDSLLANAGSAAVLVGGLLLLMGLGARAERRAKARARRRRPVQ